ncbi:MAG: hypothetical protein AAGN35_07535 [Bacteroidota bacterium]
MYREFIKRKLPHNEKLGLFVAPKLPATKLGRILMKETRVRQPGEVAALHLDSGFFGSTYVILTDDRIFWPDGSLELANIRAASADGKRLEISISSLGSTRTTRLKLGGDEVAAAIAKLLDDLAYFDPEAQEKLDSVRGDYSEFEGQAIDWLLLRDEVMRTIDMLYERFQDGKLSLIEYEEKKTQLLERL